MDNNSPWVPQEDGTHLPSAELVKRVRENPDQFPNAVEDFTALSGLPREQVEAILANPMGAGGSMDNPFVKGALNAIPGGQVLPDAWRGVTEAAGWVTKKLGAEETGESIQDFGEQTFNPEFDTERSVGENLAEVAGQAAPAVAGAAAAGGVLPAIAAGAGIAHLTFADEDNLLTLANDFVDGAVPDVLVVNPEDDADTSALKSIASNFIVDAAIGGLGAPIAKLYRIIKETPSGFVDMDTLKALSDETGVPLRDTPGSPEAANHVLRDVARKVADYVPSPVEAQKVRKAAAKDRVIQEAAERELGHPLVKTDETAPAIPEEVAQTFRQDVLGPVQRLLNRSKEVNTGKRPGIKNFEEGAGYRAYAQHAEEALRALNANNVDEVVRLARTIDKMPEATTVGHDYKTALLKASLERLDDNFEAVILRIREDPSLKTNKAWKDLASDYHADKMKLAEMYREIGSSSSYAFLTRKGVKFDDAVLDVVKKSEDELYEQLKKEGYTLFSSRAEFMASKMLSLKDMGFDTLAVLDDLYQMFDEFDAARAGVLDNLKSNKLARMSKAEREHMEQSFMRMVHDLHSSALLGQPSTALLEVMSNSINNLLLPVSQHALRGDVKRAYREYAGYVAATKRGWDTFKSAYKAGRSVTDDFDIMDNAHSARNDFNKLATEGKWGQYVFWRLWKFAADLSIASSEAQKAWRAMGVAYADGYDLAIKQGATKPEAKRLGLVYADGQFEGMAFNDVALKLDVQSTSWQSLMDTRYATGKLAQAVDNYRNHTNPVLSTMARAAVPFWRTLINIASHSLQTVQPIPSVILRPLSKTPYAGQFVKLGKFLDDFSGANGTAALQRARGRQRLGYGTMAAAWALMEADLIDVTGPSGYKRWDAKLAEMQEYPASSLIVGGKSIDLTRLLPFSAPLMLLGVMKDMKREQALQMKDGNWVAPDDSAFNVAATYGPALMTLSLTLMSDAASFRGVGDLFGAVETAAKDGDLRATIRYLQDYAKQYTPGAVRTFGKNQGIVTGDWTQDSAEGFLNEVLASAGWHTGYTRVDFLGHPVEDAFRGLDPLNTKPVKATDDPLRAEYVMLNKAGDLGLMLDQPDKVFDKASWTKLGMVPSTADWLFGNETPSLFQMKTKDGANAWDRYRDYVYKGKASKEISKSTGRYGDRLNVGNVTVKPGENFEAAMRRIIDTPGYRALTPDARVKVFKTVFGIFKSEAKDYLERNLMVDPEVFKDGRYGPLISTPTPYNEVVKIGKDRAIGVQRSRGNPLEEVFSIK